MFNFFKRFIDKTNTNTGILGDGHYDNLVRFNEMVAFSAEPQFKVKNQAEWRKFPYQYQASTSACVAFTISKIATVLYNNISNYIVKFSPAFYYVRRFNKPNEGMAFANAVDLAKTGALPYDLLPCENLTEKDINKLEVKDYHLKVADAFEFPHNWVELPVDFETVAATIEVTNKAIMLWFKFGPQEFFNQQIPVVLNKLNIWKHSVTAVDAFTYNGVKYLLIEDSASKEGVYRKLVTKEFFNNKCILARYPINFKFALGEERPHYTGTITSLQDCLKFEGFFPKNVESTGIVGKITKDALKQFQTKYALLVTGDVNNPTSATIKQLFP